MPMSSLAASNADIQTPSTVGLGPSSLLSKDTPSPPFEIPEGFKLHTENTASVLLPDTADAFLNPVQEFNRDLSIACIRTWSEERNEKKNERWLGKRRGMVEGKGNETGKRRAPEDDAEVQVEPPNKKLKDDSGSSEAPEDNRPSSSVVMESVEAQSSAKAGSSSPARAHSTKAAKLKEFQPQKVIILEALSATGLRSIRFAKEIPLVSYVIANDLSPAATAAMRRNVELNGLGPKATAAVDPSSASLTKDCGDTAMAESSTTATQRGQPELDLGKVRVNQGDACDLMYSHRREQLRVDVVDLDPYGTAAPFIDAAVQCVKDDGLICVTCTDLSVLASANYPEKCFANYGGVPAKAEYCHEVALRLVLHALSTSAARYGRFITPLLSLSIDFYVRLFVRVRTAPIEVKKAMTKTSLFHVCVGCQAFYEEKLGRVVEKQGANNSTNVNLQFKTTHSSSNTDTCVECGGKLHVAGPMWSGPIHDTEFVTKVLSHVDESPDNYQTSTRMKGMLTLASKELDSPFYFTTSRVASQFHCECPSFDTLASALFNAGYDVCRSHASAGSIKTNAPRSVVYEIMRSFILDHPVKLDKIKEETAKTLLSRPIAQTVDFTRHPSLDGISNKIKLVRYQINPQPNWGPGSRPDSGKRKKDVDGDVVLDDQ